MTRPVTAAFHAGDRDAQRAWADAFEAGANSGKVCAHNFVTPAVQRDPTLDNNAVQAEGQARCIAAQLAAIAEK